MTNQGTTIVKSGIGLNGALFITFLVLKLTNVISWSWWWVTAPLWIPFLLTIAIFIIVGLVLALISCFD